MCAAVSALVEALRFGLEEVAGVEVDFREGENAMTLVFPRSERGDMLLQAVWGYLGRLGAQFSRELALYEKETNDGA